MRESGAFPMSLRIVVIVFILIETLLTETDTSSIEIKIGFKLGFHPNITPHLIYLQFHALNFPNCCALQLIQPIRVSFGYLMSLI